MAAFPTESSHFYFACVYSKKTRSMFPFGNVERAFLFKKHFLEGISTKLKKSIKPRCNSEKMPNFAVWIIR